MQHRAVFSEKLVFLWIGIGIDVRIGIGRWIGRKFQNLWIGIGIVFVRRKVFANYSWTPEEKNFFSIFFSLLPVLDSYIVFIWNNLPGKQDHSVRWHNGGKNVKKIYLKRKKIFKEKKYVFFSLETNIKAVHFWARGAGFEKLTAGSLFLKYFFVVVETFPKTVCFFSVVFSS